MMKNSKKSVDRLRSERWIREKAVLMKKHGFLRAAYDGMSEPPHMRKRHRMRDVRASGKKERLLLFDGRDRRSDRERETLWIPEVLHGRMTKGGNASSHSFSIRCGSRLLLAFPTRGRLCFGNTAIPIQPPPLRGTSLQRKEGEW